MFRDGHFYLNISQRKQVSIRERFVNLFHDNMSFAMFQVIQVDAPLPRNMSLKTFNIDTVGNFSLDALYVLFTATHISGNYFTGSSYSLFNLPVSSLVNQLSAALDKPVSSMTNLLSTKCVISYARNSEGLFTLHVNSILIHSNLETDPFSGPMESKIAIKRIGGVTDSLLLLTLGIGYTYYLLLSRCCC